MTDFCNKKIYLMMNKPAGYVCKAVSDRHKTVFELLPSDLQALVQGAKRGQRLHTVGRLDSDTTGLLLITDDGKFSHSLTAPELGIEKKYEVCLKKEVSFLEQQDYIKKAADGILLPPEKKAPQEKAAPAKIEFLFSEAQVQSAKTSAQASTNRCIITVTEGKFHEVRRLFCALGNEVAALKRIQMANFTLPPELKEGEYKVLHQ